MSEETTHGESEKVEETNATDQQAPADTPSKKKKVKRWPIVAGVLAVVLVVAGAGFWVWHEQPSFCGAICHTPMDPYLANYDSEPGQASFDKYGNSVEDAGTMMAIAHKKEDIECIDCHVPTISEQVSEGLHWVTGNYEFPLDEKSLTDLTSARGATADEFCLNEACHNITRDELAEKTSDMKRNPHQFYHMDEDCGSCHKGHRASVMYCSRCHDDTEQPTGWLTWAEYEEMVA